MFNRILKNGFVMNKVYSICGVDFTFINPSIKFINFFDNEWREHKSSSVCKSNIGIEVTFVDNVDFLDSGFYVSRETYLDSEGIIFFCIEGGVKVLPNRQIEVFTNFTIDPFKLFWLLERILMYCLPYNHLAVLHASAVRTVDSETVLNFGFQGAGKSKYLHEELLKGGEYIADDLSIIDDNFNTYHYSRCLSIHPFLSQVFSNYAGFNIKIRVKQILYWLIRLLGINRKLTLRVGYTKLYNKKPISKSQVDRICFIGGDGLNSHMLKKMNTFPYAFEFLQENAQFEFIGMFKDEYSALNSLHLPLLKKARRMLSHNRNLRNMIIKKAVKNVARKANTL